MSQVPAHRPPKPRRIKPDKLPEVSHHTTLEVQAVEKGQAPIGVRARDVTQLLRVVTSNLGHLKKQIDSSGLYEFVFTGDQKRLRRSGALKLDTASQGVYGFLRRTDTGKFAARVPLREVNPGVAESLVSLPIQLGIEAISLRLEAIERKIEAIHQGQKWDRMARLRAGLDLLNTALRIEDPALRRDLFKDAACQFALGKALLSEELHGEVYDLKVKVEDSSFFRQLREFFPGETISAEVSRRLSPLQENVIGVLTATRYEAATWAVMGEVEAALDTVARTRNDLTDLIPDAKTLSRQIYAGIGADDPEAPQFWIDRLHSEARKLKAAEDQSRVLCAGPLMIRCEGRHLLGEGIEDDDRAESL